MTVTNPNDFKIFISKVPKENLKNTWFFPIRQDRKNPECPTGTILKNNLFYRLNYFQCMKRLNSGKNIGIYALPGGMMFLDLDVANGKMIASKELLETIAITNSSFCVQTRNGGLQYYYLNEGLYDNQVIKENGINIGELRTDWYYVVSVGSYVNQDEHTLCSGTGTYRILKNEPISQLKGLDEYIIKRTEKKENTTISITTTKKNDGREGNIFKNKKIKVLSIDEIKVLRGKYGK